MTIWQNFTLAYRRIVKNWNKYAVVMLLFMIPTLYSVIMNGIASAYVMINTSLDAQPFINLFSMNVADRMGTLDADTAETLAEYMASLNLNFGILARTMVVYAILQATLILSAVFTLFLNVPTAVYFIGIARRQPVTIKEAFKLALKSVPLTLMLYLKVFLWALLFVIPGIIKAFAYSQAYYVKADHPDWSSKQCIDHSNKMMNGKKGKLFALLLLLGIAVNIATTIIEYIVSVVSAFIPITSVSVYAVVSTIVDVIVTVGINVYAGVYENTVLAIFYEDVRRSYIDDVEQDLRRYRENEYDPNNHSNPFDSDESTSSTGETVVNDDPGTDPFGR